MLIQTQSLCPNCQSEAFECYVAFLGPNLVYLYYCDDCKFNHLTERII